MASATVAALFASMLVYGVQKLESMLIYPSNIPEGSRSNVDTPDKYNLPYDHVRIKTADNERLQTYILTVSVSIKYFVQSWPFVNVFVFFS